MKTYINKPIWLLGVAALERQSLLLFGWLLLATPGAVQAQFDYTVWNGTVTITEYTGTDGVVVIPDTITGLPVTAIGDSVFGDNTNLTSVTIPNSVISIGIDAFEGCFSLTSVTIPSSVTHIAVGAFSRCGSLSGISVETNNPAYSSVGGVLFDKSQTILIEYPGGKVGSYSIPTSVISIRGGAFIWCTNLTSVTIPNSVTSIGGFQYCTSLTSVTIPNSVTNIGDSAFYACTSLTNVTIGNSATSIGYGAFDSCSSLTSVTIPNSVISIGDGVFEICFSLTNVTIGRGVTSIGDYTFQTCTSLTGVTIPESVTSIGSGVFIQCTRLTAINVETNNSAYSSVDGVLFDKSQTTIIEYPAGNVATSYSIPNSVTNIGDSAFYACTKLTNVTIGNSVTSIPDTAFSGCYSLTSVTIGSSVTSIGDRAFQGFSLTAIDVETNNPAYSSVGGVLFDKSQTTIIEYPAGNVATSYSIPNSVTSMGEGAFYGCTSLTNVTIPNSVTSIGDGAFSYCTSLARVTIPNSVTRMGEGAFYGCTSLTAINVETNNPACSSVGGVLFDKSQTRIIEYPAGNVATSYSIPNSVTSIGDGAFEDCTSLTSLTIPNSVTSIGDGTFHL